MLLPRSLYIKSSLTPLWCMLWHCLGTELCHCQLEGHRGVTESPHWIWGWVWALTLPRDGIFSSSHKHNHWAEDVALGRVREQARPLAGQWEGLQHSEIGGQSEVWTALTFTDMCRANIISITVDREGIVVYGGNSYSRAFSDVVRPHQQTTGCIYIYPDLISCCSRGCWASREPTCLTSYKTLEDTTFGCTVESYSRVVNWHSCKNETKCLRTGFHSRPDTGRLTYRLNLHHNSKHLWMCMSELGGAQSLHHSPGPGWSWPSLRWAGSSSSRRAEAGRGAAWKAPSATPSRGRSEETGHDSITHRTIAPSPSFQSQQACSQKQNIWQI